MVDTKVAKFIKKLPQGGGRGRWGQITYFLSKRINEDEKISFVS